MNTMPWIKSYPPGVRWNMPITPAPVSSLLDASAAKYPSLPALDFMGRTTTYGELQSQVDRAAKGLQALGVGPGVHVGLFLPNTPHYFIAFFATLKVGGTVVNYSPLDAAKVLEHKIEDSRTDVLFTLDLKALYPQMAGMLGTTRLRKLIVGNVAEMSIAPEAVNKQMQSELAAVQWDDRHLRFDALMDNDGVVAPVPAFDPIDTVAVLQYTGGTTGLPKGAMLTHGNLSSACAQAWETVCGDPPVLIEAQERVLAVLPPFHIYALTVNMLFGIRGAAHITLHTRFDPKAVMQDITNKKITCFPGVPTMFAALLAHPDLASHDLRSLKYCGSGGAPLPLEIAQQFYQVTGCRLSEGWGMTETSPLGTFTPITGERREGSCGIPSPAIDIRMLSLDDPNRYVDLGERGELCIKGPNVMKGYWNNPEATAETMTADGYLRTGDVAYMDRDGFVYIVDRCKDMLLCSGYNVYPRVIEEAIYQHPSVSEVCVIGIPDAYRGQSPKAFVTLKPGEAPFDLAELQSFLKERIGKHEQVHALEIRDALPKTPVGKLSKKDLVDEEQRKRATERA